VLVEFYNNKQLTIPVSTFITSDPCYIHKVNYQLQRRHQRYKILNCFSW